MVVAFGTSGLRGPASDFTSSVCAAYTTAFLHYCSDLTPERLVFLAADLRESSPTIAVNCLESVRKAGWTPVWAGNVPTPAVAAFAMARNAPAIMITGSHIPATYNGIKFYRPDGEFLKDDEAPVKVMAEAFLSEAKSETTPISAELGEPLEAVAKAYVDRYIQGFGSVALAGLRIGVDLHSAVGRDLTVAILKGLGAEVLPFRHEPHFVAVDTEALEPQDIERARALILGEGLDAVVSTDGDGDRPMVIDDKGRQINGDVLGILTAKVLGAKTVVTPLSSTSAVEECGWFGDVVRTKIGSPYVVAAMAAAEAEPVVGFEANGGFLLQQDIELAHGRLVRLPTRDAILPAIAALQLAKARSLSLSALVGTLPPRVMRADRLKEVAPEIAHEFLHMLATSSEFRSEFYPGIAYPTDISTLDGVRMTLANRNTVHFRQSGNAPETRIYIETGDLEETNSLLRLLMGRMAERLSR